MGIMSWDLEAGFRGRTLRQYGRTHLAASECGYAPFTLASPNHDGHAGVHRALSDPTALSEPFDPTALSDCTPKPDFMPPPDLSDPFGHDGLMAAAARVVPGGYAGRFLDFDDGALTANLVDPSQQAEATQALLEFGIDIRGARVRQVRWDFAQLYDWYFYVNSRVWELDGVHQSDIDEYRNRLVYGVVDEETQRTVTTFLGSMTLPCELVIVEVRGRAELL